MNRILNSIISIGRLFIISIVFIFLIKMFSNNIDNETIRESLRYLAFVFSTLVCAKFFDKISYEELGLKFSVDAIIHFILGMLMVISVYIGMNIIFSNNSSYLFMFDINSLIYWLFVAIGEEMVFRGFIIGYINKNSTKMVAMVTSSLLFSLMHVISYESLSIYSYIYIFMVGFFLAGIRISINSIYFGVGYHLSWNYLDSIFEGTQIESWMMFSTLVLLLIVFVMLQNKKGDS